MARWRRILIGTGAVLALGAGGTAAWIWGVVDPWWSSLQAALAPHPQVATVATASDEQLARLQAENTALRTRLLEYQQIRGEGRQDPARVVVARGRVVARSLRSGRRYLELDAGAVDGVARGQAVCAGWTLVGVVAGVQDGRCLVQLITDRESRIPAAILAPGTAQIPPEVLEEGVASGLGRRHELALEYVSRSGKRAPELGMAVVTGGGDGRQPPGMVLGTISGIEPGAADHWTITLAPARDGELAESLLVVSWPGRGE
jgi:hypothetical protein